MRRKGLGPLIFIVVGAVAFLSLSLVQGWSPFLGLDLQGGVSVVLQPTDEGQAGEITDEALDDTVAIIRSRIDSIGVAEPEITRQGETVVVDIPGVENQQEAEDLIAQTGELRFRPVLSVSPYIDPEALPDTTDGTTPPNDGTTPPAEGATTPSDGTTPPAAEGEGEGEQGLGLGLGESAGAAQDPAPTPDGAEAPVAESEAPAAEGEAPAGEGDEPSTDDSVVFEPAPEDLPGIEPADGATGGEPGEVPTELPPELQAQLGGSQEITPPEQDLPDQPVTLPQIDPETGEIVALYNLGPTELTGSALEGATAQLSQTGQWIVNPVFRGGADGIDAFNAVAGTCFTQGPTCPTGQLAIVIDGEVVSAPSINAASFSRDDIEISGAFDEDSARNLATVLRYGALPIELEVVSVQAVSASLGRDALDAGLAAGAIGLVLVVLYMVGFYRLLGVAAIVKLGIEAMLLWSIIAWLGSTQGLALTLAGVTGIIVSIGVSLDSNVVFYEHLKEDIRNGRTPRSAADKSFANAWRTIVKADVASLIAAALLYWLAVGPVRGFAFYLGLSTLLDLFAAWFFMRPAVAFLLRTDAAQAHPGRFGLPALGAGVRRPGAGASEPSADDRQEVTT